MDASNPAGRAEQQTLPASSANVGVLLVNLGTPDTADARGVRVYLREFLSDPRVIENQGLFWKLALNGVILQIRPRRKARDYQKIWNNERNESPLKTITRAQAEKLGAALDGTHIVVDWAMRYGNPSIKSGIAALMKKGCDRILVVPLYPQYSASTTATVTDEALRVLASLRAQPTLRFAPPYFDDPNYIDALAFSIRQHLTTLAFEPEVIIASFHGMPQAYVDKGDPYAAHCQATMTALRARLGMDESKLKLTYQSRFGFDEWLKPYTIDTVGELATQRRETDGHRHAGLLGRLPGDAGRNRRRERRSFQAQWRRAVFLRAVPERLRRRHGRHPPARDARIAGMDLGELGLSELSVTLRWPCEARPSKVTASISRLPDIEIDICQVGQGRL